MPSSFFNKVSLRASLLCALICSLLLLLGCASTDEAPPPIDFVGLSGKHAEEAELAFAKARLLWHGQYRVTNKAPDVCRNPREAVLLLDKAIALEPDFAEALAYRALAHKDLKEYGKALSDINQAIRLEQTAVYFAYRALILIHQKRYEEAQTDVDNAFILHSKQPLAWRCQGMIYRHQENAERACDSFERACSYGDCSAIDQARFEGYCPS